MAGREKPRILLTGFGPFPGAPVNPTEALVAHLREAPPIPERAAAFHAECLDVDYDGVGPHLSRLGRAFRPDIAIHFGLAAQCTGFRLERVACNRHDGATPDNRGSLPVAGAICAGPAQLPSRLPLDAIAAELARAGLPVEWSDNAGGYLCNTVMTLSLAHACEGFAPAMSGFIHVPLVGAPGGQGTMPFDDLLRGALLIVEACAGEWTKC